MLYCIAVTAQPCSIINFKFLNGIIRPFIGDPANQVIDDEGRQAERERVHRGVAHAEVGGHARHVDRLDAGVRQSHVEPCENKCRMGNSCLLSDS